jgi:hypothetical protein
MQGAVADTSLLVLARRDPGALSAYQVRIWLREHAPAPEWAVWLARVQRIARGDPQLGFWVDADAPAGTYIVDFDARGDPPGFRGIWRVLDADPAVEIAEGSILLARRALTIEGRRLGSNQAWRRAASMARSSDGAPRSWELQPFAERFLQRPGD